MHTKLLTNPKHDLKPKSNPYRQCLSLGCHIHNGTYLTLSLPLALMLTVLTLTVTVRVTLTIVTLILGAVVNMASYYTHWSLSLSP